MLFNRSAEFYFENPLEGENVIFRFFARDVAVRVQRCVHSPLADRNVRNNRGKLFGVECQICNVHHILD